MRKRTASQSILEDLLEAQELQDGQIDRRVESQTAFVRTQGGIELHSIATVDLNLALVVFPDDAKLNDPFGDGGNLEGGSVLGILLEQRGIFERRGKLWGRKDGQLNEACMTLCREMYL